MASRARFLRRPDELLELNMSRRNLVALIALGFALVSLPLLDAQDRLKSMPGNDQYEKMSKLIPTSVKSGALKVDWKDGGKAFEYARDGTLYRYDIAERKTLEIGKVKAPAGPLPKGGIKGKKKDGPSRGRQATSVLAPNGQLKAFHRDHNLWISDPKGDNEFPVTKDGDAKSRIKYGTASWVYGEELNQNTAMWWSPDSKKIAFYRFDESNVPDYFLSLDQTKLQSKIDVEAYPKAGAPNPIADLCIYDFESKKTVLVDVRDGQPFSNESIGHYIYRIAWSPDGAELHFNRTNRLQNVMEFAAAHPETGRCRVIVREQWPASWVANAPPMRYLKDKTRFLWLSERTGWKNIYLYDLTGRLHKAVTNHAFEVAQIVSVDEAAGVLFYTARSGDNPMKLQLHRIGLDGTGDRRLTDSALRHAIDPAPDGRHFIDVAETHDVPPVTRLIDMDGKTIAELAKSDTSRLDKLGLKPVEMITFKAADGKTDLYGMLHFPSNFDPKKRYPLLVGVYAGPETNGARETFILPNALTEFGFLFASFDSRSAAGRGKRFIDALYGNLGVVEVDDQAAGVKSLWNRPYVDKSRVGIVGTSYGGYASILCLLRHPDVFQAACASSPVTDYRLYDSIYTERYMGLPQDNKAGYDAGSALTYAAKLQGRLMLYYGTSDNNVHPANTMQLVKALQKAGKSFDLQVGPDLGHSALSQARVMEFFIENLGRK
jgi:dipeptidyl-peptidase-4